MKSYWLYSIPTWLSGTLTVVAFVAFGLASLLPHSRLGATP